MQTPCPPTCRVSSPLSTTWTGKARTAALAHRPTPDAAMAGNRPTRHARGFTMLELMITVALAGILSAIAGPGMLDFIRSNRLSTAARQLDADLLLARREAIKRNVRVLVCPVGSVAGKCGSGTAQWKQGWLVCYDADQSGDCDDTTGTNPNPIRRHGPVEATLTLTGPAAAARFNANGTQGAAGAGTLTFTTTGTWSGAKSYVARVTATGNVSLALGS